ncbi:hypothetical protein CY34DRAFT_809563, partial [Suillus luteus UH-Slu-Lm8-n1]
MDDRLAQPVEIEHKTEERIHPGHPLLHSTSPIPTRPVFSTSQAAISPTCVTAFYV